MNILQNIFNDHYEELIYITHPRQSVIDNVDRMLGCGDPSFGGAMYGCTDCGNLKFVPFRCHSRFCPSCGNMYSIDRTTSMSFKLINCPHRHCVFTIPKELRHFFLEDRSLLNCLFSATRSVILRSFHKENKKELFTPGFICVLHTFGRSLQWNPHIHCLVTEGGAGNFSPWRPHKHFNYTFLRNAFCTALLNELEAKLGKSFKPVKADIYKNHIDGFYVHAKPNMCEPKQIAKYIGRYLGRPVIATKRIDKYDGENVTFHYNRHEDEKLIVETIPALEFMERLVQHIPEKNFKMMRYYGLYAKHHKQESKLFKRNKNLSGPEYKDFFSLWLKWRALILSCFKIDPLRCPKCGKTMSLMLIRFNKGKETMEEHYARIMGRPPGWKPA